MGAAYRFQVANLAGQVYFFNDKVSKSLQEFRFAKKLSQINHWKYAEQYANASLGEIYLYTDQPGLAKAYFDTVLKNEQATELRDLFQVYGCMEYYYELKNNPDKNLHYEFFVKDNGIGYTGKVDFMAQSSTGVEIIGAFIQQLDAKYRYLNDAGGFGLFIEFTIDERHSKFN